MSTERSIGRRRFLELGGLSLAAMLAGCDSRGPAWARGALRFAERRNESVERLLLTRSSSNMAHHAAPSAGAAFPAYFVSASVPRWDSAARGEWTLEVSGAVRRPLRLTLAQLTSLPRVAQRVDHFCVEGWTAVARWTGVRVSELARLAQATEDAQYVDFQSFDDGYHESWDMESAMHPQTLVAYALDGRLLGPYHGAPARVHSPIKLGYKNTKYLTRVVFLPSRNGGYWSDQGYEWFAGT
jgi:DMSO/TMAO reductase YedYZ molybdopterin-dependent catalytic subunit